MIFSAEICAPSEVYDIDLTSPSSSCVCLLILFPIRLCLQLANTWCTRFNAATKLLSHPPPSLLARPSNFMAAVSVIGCFVCIYLGLSGSDFLTFIPILLLRDNRLAQASRIIIKPRSTRTRLRKRSRYNRAHAENDRNVVCITHAVLHEDWS